MEKLQAALARAREKRDDVKPIARNAVTERPKTRQLPAEEAMLERWAKLDAFVPNEKHLQATRIYGGKANVNAQPFDILRTKLLLEMKKHGWKRIAVTSASPQSGKTTTTCNLAAGIGRQPELRGMLFDLDLRRPAIAKVLGHTPEHGIEELLAGEISFGEQALRWGEKTALSIAKRPVKDPAKLLMHSATAEVLDNVQSDYQPDIMLFDLPPILVSDETRAFLKLVDAVLIIAGAEKDSVSQIDEVEREVAQYSNVAGVVLNKCKFSGESYGYDY